MRNLDTNFGLSLVEHDAHTDCVRILAGVAARADLPAAAIADLTRDLARQPFAAGLGLQVSGQDGWFAFRLQGPEGPVREATAWIERDGRAQGVQMLHETSTPATAAPVMGRPAPGWVHAPDDGLVRSRLAATVRTCRMRREAGEFVNAAALWSALTFPAPEDAMAGGADSIPRRTLLLSRRKGLALAVFKALTTRQGSRTRSIRLGLLGAEGEQQAEIASTVSAPGELSTQGLHLLASDDDARALMGPLAATIGRVVAVPDPRLTEGERRFVQSLPAWAGSLSGRPSLMGLTLDHDLHKSMIPLAAQEHLSYRPLSVDLRDREGWAAATLAGLQFKR